MAAGTRTARGAFSVALFSCLLLLMIAPAASAQVPSVPDTGPVGDAIKDAGDTVGDTVEDTTGTVGDTVGDTGGTVGDTVDSVEDGTTGTDVGETIKDTTGSVGGTVKDAGSTAGGTVKDTTKDLGSQVDGAIKDASEATGTEGVVGGKGSKDNTSGNNNGPRKNDGKGTKKGDSAKNQRPSKEQRQQQADDRGATTSPLAAATEVTEEQSLANSAQAASFAPAFTLDEAIRQALESAKAFAFPIALTLLVVGFMLVQNKIDQKDPKLAVAAVDTADELLSFG